MTTLRHLDEANLRAVLDGEADPEATAHLDRCPRCRAGLAVLEAAASRVRARLDVVSPAAADASDVEAALARLRTRSAVATRGLFAGHRPAWVGLAAALAIAIGVSVPQVRAWTGRFLGLFRVQHITVVDVDPANLDRFQEDFGRIRPRIERLLTENATVDRGGEPAVAADVAEASKLAGFPVRLPASLTSVPRITVQPAATISFPLEVERLQSILDDAGRAEIRLPPGIDGGRVRIDVPAVVTAAWGNCADVRRAAGESRAAGPAAGGEERCTLLVEAPSPVITAPPELDVEELGEAALRIVGYSAEEARRVAETIDWTSTLVLPLPSRGGMRHDDVSVDGAPAVVVEGPERIAAEHRPYTVLWVKDGIMHALIGHGTAEDALTVAGSMR
ncbi:MAG: hypothetical protein LAO51_09890 [Acidobacteriia bacterium]|nr:hypothetical protein [Terriglobia bacterium]